ncbi:MAG TPA: FAD-dependent oxidoreductase [Ktedonobacteraceae bacterium]
MEYVIIGNGIAGVTAAETLRAEDPSCSITIVSDDPFPVYYRPGLKDFLGGRMPEEKLWARPTTFYSDHRIRFIRGRVMGIDTWQHCVQLHDGKRIGYSKLLLANGAHPRQLFCPGLNLAGVYTLRTVADYQEILGRLSRVSRVVVCGSGTLALESAETLRSRNYEVTHLMRGNTLWSEVLDPIASDLVLQEERRDGVDVRTGEEIAEIVGKRGQVSGIITSHGEHIPCQLVLIAIGIEPALDFIRVSGITCGAGVKVDAGMRTNIVDIYAAGDVIETRDEFTGRTRVLGQWFPAISQARIAAYTMLGRLSPGQHHNMNYFNATFLYGLDFVSIGLSTRLSSPDFSEIVADPQPRSYRKIVLKDGIIVGALLLGDRRQALAFKRAIDSRLDLVPVAGRLFAPNFDLDAWFASQGIPNPVLDAFLVPVPHPAISIAMSETCLPDYHNANGISIGRQEGMSLRIPHGSVSRFHAEITVRDREYVLRDKGSSNGTFINGMHLKSDTTCKLRHNDSVRFGDVQFRFELRPRDLRSGSHVEHSYGTIKRPTQKEEPVVVGLEHRQKVQRLGEERVRFEIDMCIGCNRCMDVCPVPLSSQVTIADLNTATTSERIVSSVAHFTHECILCGSCVPICPVDNHRDLLMLSLKERLGVSWQYTPEMKHVVDALPAGWTIAMLAGRLREQAFLRNLQLVPDTYVQHILAASKQSILPPRETVIREGEYGRDLYLVLQGLVELTATDAGNKELPLAVIRRGEYVGEDGMLTGLPYKASARAQTPVLLLQVPEQVMQRLMELVPGVRHHFEHFNNAHSLKSILKRMALFAGVADADIEFLIHSTSVRQYERNEQLFTEDNRGRPPRETLQILLEGFVKVARNATAGTGQSKSHERIMAYRQGGDYFAGGLDLLGDGHAVTVTTINRCRVAEVPRHALLALFQRYPEVNYRFSVRLREYIETAVSTQGYQFATGTLKHFLSGRGPADPHVQEGLHSLVKDGVMEGTEVLVIDLDKCIHCNECEEACERRHGHSRMNRKGMVVGNISIATACRQCSDPVCMLCSRAGIARHPNGEVYITESCIGCGICAERCPYGAISIVQVDDETEAGSSWQRFSAFFTKGAGKEHTSKSLPVVSVNGRRATAKLASTAAPGPLDVPGQLSGYDEMRKKVAIKCDLCAGYGDQACVQACPTGAAIRVQPTTFFGSTEEILRRRAN